MLEAVGLSDPGCVRTNNEDFFVLSPSLDLYLIADGMGGARAGEHASRLAGETVAEFMLNAEEPNSETLLHALAEANRKVLRVADSDPQFHGMGTTLTAAWRVGDDLLLANVGDSRAYMWQEGVLHAITEDQTWVNEVGRKLGIDEEHLKVHPMRHVLTMAIGVSDALRIHSYAVPLIDGSLFLLCSDGLHGVVDAKTIGEILSSPEPLESKCQFLVDAARRAGGPDNITAVIIAVKPEK
ncbi:MAG: protein phosphatase 2C domain-containing protein [Bryobacteraceae bacterium]|nr:protein phosphatase 2C domain-containing protein [Bryobacteraceae bacterium]